MDQQILFPDTPFDLEDHLILLGRRGSEAHGTYIPPEDPNSIDDRDLMGIVIPSRKYYIGLSHWEHAESIKECWDVVLYEYRKFVNLLIKQNPNGLGLLWLEPEDYLYKNWSGGMLISHRDLFRCRSAAAASFGGYAMSQLKKMQNWTFNGYMGAKRKSLVEKYGYDTKNAAHLIRLLNMGIEYLETGKLRVRRTVDRDLLLDIKKGKWNLQDIKELAESKRNQLNYAEEHSVLPETINFDSVEDLVMSTLQWVVSPR